MNLNDFETYRVDELDSIFIKEHNPESMTIPYSFELVKETRIKRNLQNDQNVFIVSTQKKKPRYHFKNNEIVEINGPFFEQNAVCIFQQEYIHKGFRMIGYFFQFIE
ncbi:hypothetical protein AADQ00_05930 [Escherichia coli]|nr:MULTISPECIES: hypothetical protein [Enterobacteriaceae]CDK49202.1 hypothetical protein [Escherichia coli IS1]HCJ7771046.1 hypothetical protein [Citrobacter freundii]EEV5812729.1 hypothetical protein [Escherichia coli]EFC1823790.1 hypothetical protein [Escherichia coli]EFF2198456.1 hypothetical protein [Escherichia coli]